MRSLVLVAVLLFIPVTAVAQTGNAYLTAAPDGARFEVIASEHGRLIRLDRFTGVTAILNRRQGEEERFWDPIEHRDRPTGLPARRVHFQIIASHSDVSWLLVSLSNGRTWRLEAELDQFYNATFRWVPVRDGR